jgi:hypothetical protein
MQLRIVWFTALLPHILANDFFIPVTAYRTDERAFGPKLATPQTLFDGRDAVKDLAGRETFDYLDNLGRAVARYRLHQKMAHSPGFSGRQQRLRCQRQFGP